MPSRRSGFPTSSVLGVFGRAAQSTGSANRCHLLARGSDRSPELCILVSPYIVEGESSHPNGHGYEEHLVS